LNSSLQYSHFDTDALRSSLQENIFPDDSTTFEDSRSHSKMINNNYVASFRMEWNPDDKTTVIFTPRFNYSHSNTFSDSYSLSYDDRNDQIYQTEENTYSRSTGYNLNGDLTFSRKLNENGRVLTVGLSGGYSDRDNAGDNYSLTEYYRRTSGDPVELLDQIFSHTNNGHNYRVNISWVEPLGRNNFLQFSYNFRRNKQESVKSTYSIDDKGAYTLLDSAYSQSYENDFINQVITLNFQARREKYRYTIGFQAVPSYSRSRTFVEDKTLSDLSRSVVNFSPTASFDYLWNRRTNLRISYSGETSQPSITQLQPVAEIANATNIRIGNPDLKPSYTNRMSARY
ncbi:MAG: outer membrane beta-barrel family protein, partial [Tannerellaceae bacterium]|nr:outer membrane beta-barrel family protein [Tannerellaceae bacterium]